MRFGTSENDRTRLVWLQFVNLIVPSGGKILQSHAQLLQIETKAWSFESLEKGS